MTSRTRSERRAQTAAVKARRSADILNSWGGTLQSCCHYAPNGERRSCARCIAARHFDRLGPARHNTLSVNEFLQLTA